MKEDYRKGILHMQKRMDITEMMKKRILVLDGAMGTMLQQAALSATDFGGEAFEGCNEYLNLTRPDVIREIHKKYFLAGADIVETNSFGATPLVLDDFGLGHLAYDINKKSVELAIEARKEVETKDSPKYIAGSIGPTTKTLSVTGGITFDELVNHFRVQIEGLVDGGADILLVETSQDLLNVKAAYLAIRQVFKEKQIQLPIIISGTIEPMGTTLAGQNIEAFYYSVEHMKPIAVGLNCATGPELMKEHLRTLAEQCRFGVSCYPNAGLPDEDGHYHETPDSLARKLSDFAKQGWLNIVGGCCGTTPAHIQAIRAAIDQYPPRKIDAVAVPSHHISNIEPLAYDFSMRPLLVGERTNVIGSRKFRDLIANEEYEEASEIARRQVKNGAHVIDVCLANPDRNESYDMQNFMPHIVRKVKVPIMVDSTDRTVVEVALKCIQGKSIINSVNLEDGEKHMLSILPLVQKYGCALVVGTIDEQGMGVTWERKLEIARRSYDLLVCQNGLSPSDLIFDPLVFPVGTGDVQYTDAALETVKGIQAIKKEFPDCLTVLGLSNVSFGLPGVGREVLNSVFLYHCTKAGLDYAIVNTEKLMRYASISAEEIALSENLLFQNSEENLAKFTNFYREKKREEKEVVSNLSLEERLMQNIVEGTKEGLSEDIALALQKYADPLDIINGPLMEGMNQVGKLFNDNQLIVAEVLQSAEVMKAAVALLKPHMPKNVSVSKGKMLIATVKGDVHDIGKNLVSIILENNGFDVVDLGIKVTSQEIIEAVQRENPTCIGLSGLLVKSAHQMVATASDLKAVGIDIPIQVGGAALTKKFTKTRIAPVYDGLVLYAKDAMESLQLANQLHTQKGRAKLEVEWRSKIQVEDAPILNMKNDENVPSFEKTIENESVRIPPDTRPHLIKNYDFRQIVPYINMQMLLGHHLGLKGKVEELLAAGDKKALQLKISVDEMINRIWRDHLLDCHAIYQFFPCQSDADDLLIYNPKKPNEILETFHFPRQKKEPFLCLSDYVHERSSGIVDYVGMFVVTTGKRVIQTATQFKQNGEFLNSHLLLSIALEGAEGFAELVHQRMRDQWQIGDASDLTMKDRLHGKYIGQRFSFGYPACPDLADQEKLFRLLKPQQIDVSLTEGHMMHPEGSVSAIVFAHSKARYFTV